MYGPTPIAKMESCSRPPPPSILIIANSELSCIPFINSVTSTPGTVIAEPKRKTNNMARVKNIRLRISLFLNMSAKVLNMIR